jgi:hypothetical protein
MQGHGLKWWAGLYKVGREMETHHVICGLLAVVGGWACVPGTAGREVPIHRDYSQPIQFYDESGAAHMLGEVALDVSAQKQARDRRDQEAWMGQETILEVTFGEGTSVFGRRNTPVGGPVPGTGGDGGRSKATEDRNWLAGSLPLPTLGQTATNAAEGVLLNTTASSWGWLAADVAAASLPVEGAQEEEMAAVLREVELLQSVASLSGDGSGMVSRSGPTASGGVMGPAAAGGGGQPTASRMEPAPETGAARPLLSGAIQRPANRSAPLPTSAFPMAEMSQTAKLISDMSSAVRPDLGAWRESLPSAPSRPSGAGLTVRPEPEASSTRTAPVSFAAPVSAGWGGMNSRETRAIPVNSSWHGGWNAQQGSGRVSMPAFGASSPRLGYGDEATPVVPPAVTRESLQMPFSSGGDQPAWR